MIFISLVVTILLVKEFGFLPVWEYLFIYCSEIPALAVLVFVFFAGKLVSFFDLFPDSLFVEG